MEGRRAPPSRGQWGGEKDIALMTAEVTPFTPAPVSRGVEGGGAVERSRLHLQVVLQIDGKGVCGGGGAKGEEGRFHLI